MLWCPRWTVARQKRGQLTGGRGASIGATLLFEGSDNTLTVWQGSVSTGDVRFGGTSTAAVSVAGSLRFVATMPTPCQAHAGRSRDSLRQRNALWRHPEQVWVHAKRVQGRSHLRHPACRRHIRRLPLCRESSGLAHLAPARLLHYVGLVPVRNAVAAANPGDGLPTAIHVSRHALSQSGSAPSPSSRRPLARATPMPMQPRRAGAQRSVFAPVR